MGVTDYLVFILYMIAVMAVGFYHFRKNRSEEDYYVGGRSIPPTALGLSIVATDVGGGFSIGLGGVGFLMGLSGTWLLFTGLLGAWLSAVFVLPRIKGIDAEHSMMTYPDFLRFRYGERVALLAAVISGVGYLLFSGGQILAGATLASQTVLSTAPFGWDTMQFALVVMGIIIVVYTALGGIKAVIYTDCVQWIILLGALALFAVPLALREVGGVAAFRASLPDNFFSLTAIKPVTVVNWMVTIVPIWLVGMTLYQRMFACKGLKEARRAWYIAGVFEYPVMAFLGVLLGMCARIVYPQLSSAQAELGLPMLINDILPLGITGVVVAAYFSAIMSTADSCIMASSGNLLNDLLKPLAKRRGWTGRVSAVRLSQIVTLGLGTIAVIMAARFQNVLEAILHAYSFLVSGLFVPTLGAFFWPRSTASGAFWGMIAGGGTTVLLISSGVDLPFGLDPTFWGLLLSAAVFVTVSLLTPSRKMEREPEATMLTAGARAMR